MMTDPKETAAPIVADVEHTHEEWVAILKAKGSPVDPFFAGGAPTWCRWYPNTMLTEAQYLAGVEAVRKGLVLGGHGQHPTTGADPQRTA